MCHNPRCWVSARAGEGHSVSHSKQEQRYQCKRCGATVSATQATALSRLHHPRALVVTVITLRAFGCPVQAVVAAFGLDERTVAAWQRRAGRQGERVHGQLGQAGRVTLGQVQADELRVRIGGGADRSPRGMQELLRFPVPLPAVKRRGRPPTWLREVVRAA